MVPSDIQLVQRSREGDLDAFESLYQRYSTVLFRSLLAITRDPGTAEDLLQESFVRAYNNLHRVDESVSSLSPWLHRIALNLAYNWVERHRPRWPELEVVLERLVAGPASAPDRQLERSELKRAIWDAIQHLDEKHRLVIVMHYLHDMSLAEIAEVLDCPAGTVKSRLYYAREQLRQSLVADKRIGREVALGWF